MQDSILNERGQPNGGLDNAAAERKSRRERTRAEAKAKQETNKAKKARSANVGLSFTFSEKYQTLRWGYKLAAAAFIVVGVLAILTGVAVLIHDFLSLGIVSLESDWIAPTLLGGGGAVILITTLSHLFHISRAKPATYYLEEALEQDALENIPFSRKYSLLHSGYKWLAGIVISVNVLAAVVGAGLMGLLPADLKWISSALLGGGVALSVVTSIGHLWHIYTRKLTMENFIELQTPSEVSDESRDSSVIVQEASFPVSQTVAGVALPAKHKTEEPGKNKKKDKKSKDQPLLASESSSVPQEEKGEDKANTMSYKAKKSNKNKKESLLKNDPLTSVHLAPLPSLESANIAPVGKNDGAKKAEEKEKSSAKNYKGEGDRFFDTKGKFEGPKKADSNASNPTDNLEGNANNALNL